MGLLDGIIDGIPFPGSNETVFGSAGRSNTNYNSRTNTRYNNRTNPFITGEYKGMEGLMKNLLMKRLTGGGLPAGYQENAIRGINSSYGDVLRGADNKMASRGIFGDAGHGAAVSAVEAGRAGSIADMKMNAPLIAQALESEALGMGQGMVNAFGRGETSSGTSRSDTSGSSDTYDEKVGVSKSLTGPDPNLLIGSGLGGGYPPSPSPGSQGVNATMNMLMFMYGSGAFGGGKK